MVQRSETPAFPVKRETPLPFHPLLFDGAEDTTMQHQRGTPHQYARSINYRYVVLTLDATLSLSFLQQPVARLNVLRTKSEIVCDVAR
jgi:hypothetical protein